ncbi:spore coat putative kinase YutH [Aeribacillus pallidus]|uniref:Spore coat protein YutH n=1 Tax=Aeribacillus pallidus TaxID=33936 RepID=A0A223E559_9BACI|nr:spore coat protein YutH [Aeribacillus pallidus]ASS90359.1 spore coat protein YutH [Aeribacillus pallidus]
MKELLKKHYGIDVLDFFSIGQWQGFKTKRNIGFIAAVSHIDHKELYELYEMSRYLLMTNERKAASFLLTVNGDLTAEHNGTRYAVFQIPQQTKRLNITSLGKELSFFHEVGRRLPFTPIHSNRIGQWRNLWARRIDQMEQFWSIQIASKPHHAFDKLFIESFPYYLGLGENAIQYLADTELDDRPLPVDSGTICHQRFTREIWENAFSLPVDFVFDHGGRDIAECLRYDFLTGRQTIDELFLAEYDRASPLSSFFWRLVFSRLLFPVHYFECVENYYLAEEEERDSLQFQMEKILQTSSQYEQFLSSFSSMIYLRKKQIVLPALTWL